MSNDLINDFGNYQVDKRLNVTATQLDGNESIDGDSSAPRPYNPSTGSEFQSFSDAWGRLDGNLKQTNDEAQIAINVQALGGVSENPSD